MDIKKIIIAVIIVIAGIFMYNKFSAAEIINVGNGGSTIVCFGDSLTRGHGAPQGSSYPDVLAKMVDRRVVNLGVNGDTAPAGLARIEQIKEHNPYMVIIEFSGNDFMRQVPFDQTIAATEKMVDYVQKQGAIAVVVETGGNFMLSKYGKEFKRISKEKGAIFVPAIMDDILNNPKLKSDQIHANAEGYKIVAQRVHKRIEKYL
ncbi:lysophospholipase L1-like esterase [Elusimicrobium posterum]|uniref:GDSL-type esterase/lipase family protein n=1 Tax=Elusimicrobium posterum TaxID=3116653 RepID=UPI003C7152A9